MSHSVDELLDLIKHIPEIVPDVKHIPRDIWQEICSETAYSIKGGGIRDPKEMAAYMAAAVRERGKDYMSKKNDPTQFPPQWFTDPAPEPTPGSLMALINQAQKNNLFSPYGRSPDKSARMAALMQAIDPKLNYSTMQQQINPDWIATDPTDDEPVTLGGSYHALAQEWQKKFGMEDCIVNPYFADSMINFQEWMADTQEYMGAKAQGFSIEPKTELYRYLKSFTKGIYNSTEKAPQTFGDLGAFLADVLMRFEGQLKDKCAPNKGDWICELFKAMTSEDSLDMLSDDKEVDNAQPFDDLSEENKRKRLRKVILQHVKGDTLLALEERANQNKWKKEDDEPMLTTTTGLPKLSKEQLEKLDAVTALMLDKNIKVSQIYGAALGYEQEVVDLKKKIESTPQPVGIKAITINPTTIRMSWYDRLATDIKLGRTIAVRGPAGNGKSTGIKEVLNGAGYTIYHLDCTDSTTVDQLVGGLEPVPDGKGGLRMEFKEGIFSKAFKDPKGAIQLDEFDALDPRVTMALQSALHRAAQDKTRSLSCPDHPDRIITAVADCPIVVSMNTWGAGATREYVGRNAIDAASLDRFDTIINTDYEQEEVILESMGMPKSSINELMKEIKHCRKVINDKGLRVVLSTRRVLNIAEAVLKLDLTTPRAISREFVERLDEYDRSALQLTIVK